MGKFATGKKSYAISDRSGQRYPYHVMKEEWNGLLVGPDEYEPKHPQLEPRTTPTDPQALQNPRPDRVEPLRVFVGVPLVENNNLKPATAYGFAGIVTVTTS